MPRRIRATVEVRGNGPAALAAARCLVHHRIPTRLVGVPPAAGPNLLLNRSLVALLHDLFQCEPALRAAGHIVRGRLVAWGSGANAPAMVEEPGLAIAAQVLQRLLRQSLKSRGSAPSLQIAETAPTEPAPPPNWTVEARARAALPASEILPAGKRVAIVCEVRLSGEADASLATIESVDDGWLFLLPLGARRAALQAIVPEKPANHKESLSGLLANSRIVAPFVAAVESESRAVPCAPHARLVMTRGGWIAAGDAAVAFDPICGDGTGQALRSGLLAAAVIEAILRGDSEADCLAHYRARLAFAFHTHLRTVSSFYESSRARRIWQGEIRETAVAIEHILRQRSDEKSPRYHLERFRLQRTRSQGAMPAE